MHLAISLQHNARVPASQIRELIDKIRADKGSGPIEVQGPASPGIDLLASVGSCGLSLLEEVQRLRSLLDRVYDLVPEVKGTEALQAELEREVMSIRSDRP